MFLLKVKAMRSLIAMGTSHDHPLMKLDREDLDLITALVLEGSSLKGLAARYGVSYPTIRGRVDRVIERVRAITDGRTPDPLRELLADLVERGELTGSAARRIVQTAELKSQSTQLNPEDT